MFSIDCAGLAWGAVVVLRARVAGLIRLLTLRSRVSLSLRCLVRFGLLSFAPLFAGGSRTWPSEPSVREGKPRLRKKLYQ